MAKQKVVGSRKTVRVWISGSHAQLDDLAVHVHVENDDKESRKTEGFQHEAAYQALIDVMIREHVDNTTELLIHTGNDVVVRGLLHPGLTDKEHLHRHEEIVKSLTPLFDVVMIEHRKQRKALPITGSASRAVLARPLGHGQGHVI